MSEPYLCLSDLLDQDPTAFEYFQTLPPEARRALQQSDAATFEELQTAARQWKQNHPARN